LPSLACSRVPKGAAPSLVVTANECSTLSWVVVEVTLNAALVEVIPPNTALIWALPMATALASPLLPPALLMVATMVLSELQVALVVRS
jgi:hypothetical protein